MPEQPLIRSAYFEKFNGVVIENFNGLSIRTMLIPETSWGEISVKKLIQGRNHGKIET